MLSSESKSLEKEKAESGPVMCFQTDSRTEMQTAGAVWGGRAGG